ncbi:MAG: two pore domain potassium channel family protein [Alistipes sp.]|nr:two pore domain potassium channel family protein [Alistipes sp.]
MKNDNIFARLIYLIAGVALLVGLSIEVLSGDHLHYSSWYMWLQLVVCIVFMIDFATAMVTTDNNSSRWFWLNLLFFLISIPYLNILSWMNVVPHRGVAIVVAALPLLRSFIAMGVVVWWFIVGKVSRIFAAYLFTVVCFTYLAALIFYDFEILVNDKLNGFGNALWWAWMNTTTVGAAIFPVTTIGKVLAVLLPSLGMMFFPIFTIYVTNIYNVKSGKNKK